MDHRLVISAIGYNYRISILPLKLTIIVFFIISSAIGQTIESAYKDKLESGTTIYAITNRAVKDNDPSVYSNQVREGQNLDYLVTTYYKPDSLVSIKIDSSDFVSRICDTNNNWLLFVHGDSKTFDQAIMRGYDIQYYHNVNVIVFSWPTKDSELNGMKNFKNSKKNALATVSHFGELMKFMGEFRDNCHYFRDGGKLSVFFHSLGNSLIENLVIKDSSNNDKSIIFDNVILNSAAVNQRNHKQWVEKLSFQNRLYITSNKSDFNLKGVRIFTKDGKQLGEIVKQPIAENAFYLNFSDAIGFRTPTGTTHTFFIGEVPEENGTIKNLYYNLFHGNKINLLDTITFEERRDGVGYNIIKPN